MTRRWPRGLAGQERRWLAARIQRNRRRSSRSRPRSTATEATRRRCRRRLFPAQRRPVARAISMSSSRAGLHPLARPADGTLEPRTAGPRVPRDRRLARTVLLAERQGPSARPCEGPRARHPRSERALLPDQPQARVPHGLGRHRRAALPADRESGRRELPGELDDRVQRSPAPPAGRDRRRCSSHSPPIGAAKCPKA